MRETTMARHATVGPVIPTMIEVKVATVIGAVCCHKGDRVATRQWSQSRIRVTGKIGGNPYIWLPVRTTLEGPNAVIRPSAQHRTCDSMEVLARQLPHVVEH